MPDMPDNFVLNEGDQPVAMAIPSKVSSESIARYVSLILSPAVVSLPLIGLVAQYKAHDPWLALGYGLLVLFFISIGPFGYILIGVRRGKFVDADVSDRSQRLHPFLFGLASASIGLIALLLLHGPKSLQTLLLFTLISGTILTIITQWWKISIHASSLAGAVTLLTFLYGAIMLPAFLLVVLVGWSRVVLKHHTLAQVIVGATLSTLLAVIVLTLLGS